MLTPITKGSQAIERREFSEAIEQAQRINTKRRLFLFSAESSSFLVRPLLAQEARDLAKEYRRGKAFFCSALEQASKNCVLYTDGAALDGLRAGSSSLALVLGRELVKDCIKRRIQC